MTTGFSDEVLELGSNDSSFEFSQGSVSGIRSWLMFNEKLIGHYNVYWTESAKFATCYRAEHLMYLERTAPHPKCTCGIYALWYNCMDIVSQWGPANGVIEGYGKTIIGSKGFRTQKARIKALCFDSNLIPGTTIEGVWDKDKFKAIAKRFGVPFYEDTEAMIADHPLTSDYLPTAGSCRCCARPPTQPRVSQ